MSNPLEQHRFTFDGSTSLLARHLVDDHGVSPKDVARWRNGMTQGHWVALDDLHKQAHESMRGEGMGNKLHEAAQRVTGYIRARALMSNTDPEVVSDIAVMPEGAGAPMEFRLLVSDLEALASHATGGLLVEADSPEGVGKYGGCPVLNCGYKIEDDRLPDRPVANFGDEANEVINMVAEQAEALTVAAMIAHHVIDHTPGELMDTITHFRAKLRFHPVMLPEDATAEIVDVGELERLRAASAELDALHASGVDNWEGYAEARSNR